jgi:4'-phosphopantetheinyl transferase
MKQHSEAALGSVHLWRVDLDIGAEAEAGLRKELPASEIARAERLTRPRARRRFVVARGTLRALLGGLLDERPASIAIEAGPSGKPRLADSAQGLHFNVSHSEDLALICIADWDEVGVDLEAVRAVPSAVAIARRHFASAEASFVERGGSAEADRRFLLCWTRKEAVAKAVGSGLSLDLRCFTVPLAPPGGIVRLGDPNGEPAERWLLLDVPVGDEHVAALALPTSAVGDCGSPAAGPAQAWLGRHLNHCSEIEVMPLIKRIGLPGRPSP